DLVRRQRLDARYELAVKIVRQVEQSQLGDGACQLIARLEVLRVAACECRDADRQLGGRNGTRFADIRNFFDRLADGQCRRCLVDADIQHERAGRTTKFEGGANSVRDALLTA